MYIIQGVSCQFGSSVCQNLFTNSFFMSEIVMVLNLLFKITENAFKFVATVFVQISMNCTYCFTQQLVSLFSHSDSIRKIFFSGYLIQKSCSFI